MRLKTILTLLIVLSLGLSWEINPNSNKPEDLERQLNEVNIKLGLQQFELMTLKAEKISLEGKITALETIQDNLNKQRTKDFIFNIALTIALAYSTAK